MFNIIKIVKEKKFNDETIRLIKEMGLLDENEEQKKPSCNKIIVTIILLLFLSITSIWCYEIFKSSQGIISANLVCEKGSYNPAFLGFEFTPELESAIKSGKIDLYGIYICHTTDVDEDAVFLKESSEAIAGTVNKLRIVKKEYIEYSENYINTYFSKEAADKMREEDDIGYWKYTIDIVD